MSILARISALAATATEAQRQLMSHEQGSFDKFLAAQNGIEREMNAIDKDAGPGLVPGRCLSFGVADGYASYMVTKVRKNDVAVVHIPYGDAWTWQGVYQNAKGELVLPRPVAEATALRRHF